MPYGEIMSSWRRWFITRHSLIKRVHNVVDDVSFFVWIFAPPSEHFRTWCTPAHHMWNDHSYALAFQVFNTRKSRNTIPSAVWNTILIGQYIAWVDYCEIICHFAQTINRYERQRKSFWNEFCAIHSSESSRKISKRMCARKSLRASIGLRPLSLCISVYVFVFAYSLTSWPLMFRSKSTTSQTQVIHVDSLQSRLEMQQFAGQFIYSSFNTRL